MKNYSFLVVILLSSIGIKAQDATIQDKEPFTTGAGSISLNLYGGYVFADKVEYNGYYARVEDGIDYGIGLEYFVEDETSVELKYSRMTAEMPFYGLLGNQINAGDSKGAVNYILLGGTHYFESNSTSISPYLGGGIGLGIIETPQNGNDSNFAWDIKAGVKINTNSLVSVNLQAYLKSMVSAVGDDYYWTYYGLVGVVDYESLYQFGLGAVLSFNFE